MKNPFEKQDNTILIASIAIGALSAGTFAWLYLTESGANTLRSISHRFKEGVKEVAADAVSQKTRISKKAAKAVADHVVK